MPLTFSSDLHSQHSADVLTQSKFINEVKQVGESKESCLRTFTGIG